MMKGQLIEDQVVGKIKAVPSQVPLVVLRDSSATLEMRYGPSLLNEGSSVEFWSMNVNVNRQYLLVIEAYRLCKL